MMKLTEKLIRSKEVYHGHMIHLRKDEVELPNGKLAGREVVVHPGAVAIVPVRPDGKIVLVRQYRHPVGEELLEIPAGKLDAGELPDDCAKRELSEETGYEAGKFTFLTRIFTAPGFTDEAISLYVAEDLIEKNQHPDEDEFLNVEVYTKQEVKEMIADGRLHDAKSLTALLMYLGRGESE